LDDKRLYEILSEIGLSKRKADIYLFLLKKGLQKAQSIAAHLGIDRAQTYRLLRSLKQKGMVEETIESPTRYIAIPIENLIEAHLKDKKSEIAHLEAEKTNIINYFKSISKKEPECPMAKFQIITGRNGIYTKISQMVNESKKEVSGLTTSLGLIQEDTLGILDTIIESAQEKQDVQFKMLANISQDNLNTIKSIVERLPTNNPNIEWRHTIVGSRYYPRFVIKDEEEILLYVTTKDEQITSPKEDNGLWVASKMFVSTLKASFMEIWHNAINVNDRIKELETGTPREETTVIKEPADTQTKIKKVLATTKNEIMLISSAIGINKLWDNDLFQEHTKRGIKFRVMAPIDLDNLRAAQELSKLYEIKHVSISYLTMMIADSKHLFIFKAPPLEEKITSPFYLRNTFYTNDKKYVERANELLNDIWKRGTLLSEIGAAGSMGTPVVEVPYSSTILEVVEVMLKNNVRSVLVRKNNNIIGIIDQRDILDKMLKTKKNPDKTPASEVMSTPILVIDSDEPLIAALKTIKEKRIPRLAVMKKGKLIAMLT
jgi:sugar-specific transcriptional regulator TrmB/CBS domain-containing protein